MPFGVLAYKSGFIPRILGVFLLANGGAYIGLSLTGVLAPERYPAVLGFAWPLLFGELAMMLWLTIAGARPRRLRASAPSPAAG